MITLYYNIAKYERKNYEPRSEGSGAVVEVVEKLRRFLEKYVLENQNLSWDTHQSILALFADVVVYKDTIECISPGVFRQVKNVYRYSELNDIQKKYVLTKISKYFTFIRNKCKDVLLNPEEKAETKELAKFFYNVSQPKSLGVMLNFPDDSCIYVVNSTPVISLSGWKHVKSSEQEKEIYSLIPEDSEDDEGINLSVDAIDPIEQYYSTYHYFNENDLPYAHPDLKDLNAKFGDLLESVSAGEIKELWPNAANERFLPNPDENQTGEVKVSSSDEEEEDPDPASFNFKTDTNTQASVSPTTSVSTSSSFSSTKDTSSTSSNTSSNATSDTSSVSSTSSSTTSDNTSSNTNGTKGGILSNRTSKTKLTEFGGDLDFENIVHDKTDPPKLAPSNTSEDEIVVAENEDVDVKEDVVVEENATEEVVIEKDLGVEAVLEESIKKPLVSPNNDSDAEGLENTFDVEGEVVKENNNKSSENNADAKKADTDKTTADINTKKAKVSTLKESKESPKSNAKGGSSKIGVILIGAILLAVGACAILYFMPANDIASNTDNNQANTTDQISSQRNDIEQVDSSESFGSRDLGDNENLSTDNLTNGNSIDNNLSNDKLSDNTLMEDDNVYANSSENTNSIDDSAIDNGTEVLNTSDNESALATSSDLAAASDSASVDVSALAPTSAVDSASNTVSSNALVSTNVSSKDEDNVAKKTEEVTTSSTATTTATTTAATPTSNVSQQQANSKGEEKPVQAVDNAKDSSAASEFENVAIAFLQGYSDKIKTTIKKNGSEICTIRARFEYVTDKVVLSTKNTNVKDLCGYDISAIECKSDFTNCYFVFANDGKKEKVQSEGVTSKLGKKK